ncbi:MAG TPA: rod shape-determining protein RodA [Vicinamibacterales bacterium]|nr:rod shape-determining protein RodA [Vicinamibacterales bacterium]
MIFERRLAFHIDWALIGAILALAGMGLAMIYSTTYDLGAEQAGREFWTQMQAIVLGVALMALCMSIDYRAITQRSLLIYGGVILLLIAVFFVGVVRGGSRRWIPLGFFNLQPSEFGRIAIALVLAMYFGENRRGARLSSDLLLGAAFTLVPFLLIARQPDLGTAVTLLPVFLGIVYLAGLRMRLLVVAAVIGVLLSPLAWNYALKPYQKERIQTFLDPERDSRGAGYQQIQARVTVGSGGLTGKGFQKGTQGGYGFLPVAHNDFVFSVLAEEHGFLGVLVALGLYLFVILRSLDAARLAKDKVGTYLVVGIVSGFMFQVMYNITMSAGLAPVKGLTLPLMSYGGSSLIATFAAFGLILNVRMRRFTN